MVNDVNGMRMSLYVFVRWSEESEEFWLSKIQARCSILGQAEVQSCHFDEACWNHPPERSWSSQDLLSGRRWQNKCPHIATPLWTNLSWWLWSLNSHVFNISHREHDTSNKANSAKPQNDQDEPANWAATTATCLPWCPWKARLLKKDALNRLDHLAPNLQTTHYSSLFIVIHHYSGISHEHLQNLWRRLQRNVSEGEHGVTWEASPNKPTGPKDEKEWPQANIAQGSGHNYHSFHDPHSWETAKTRTDNEVSTHVNSCVNAFQYVSVTGTYRTYIIYRHRCK